MTIPMSSAGGWGAQTPGTTAPTGNPVQGVKCRGTRRDGQPCTNPPMNGGKVCRMHGGSAPQVKAAAARNLVEQKAAATVTKIGPHVAVTDPLAALGELAGEVLAVKTFLRGLVDSIQGSMRTTDDKNAEQMRAEMTAYSASLRDSVQTLATIAKLNIDERLARIEEAKKAMIIDALRRAWAEMGISGEAQTRGMATFSRHLRVVGSEHEKRTP